jgi:hypothetical protein
MAIGNSDFTSNQQKGLGFFFNCAKNWTAIEPLLITYLQNWGTNLSIEENAADAQFKLDLEAVIADLKVDPSQMPAVKTLLGI